MKTSSKPAAKKITRTKKSESAIQPDEEKSAETAISAVPTQQSVNKPTNPSTTMMKRLVISSTNKGGAGKSFFCVNLVEWLKSQESQPEFKAFDPDHANKTLLAFHPDVTEFVDVDRSKSMDACVQVLGTDVDISVVDGLGSQQKKAMMAWAEEINLFEVCEDVGVRITFVNIVEDDRDLIRQLKELMTEIGNKVDWVLVRNHKQSKEFFMWENSAAQKQARDLNAIEIELPRVPDHLAAWCNDKALTLVAAQTFKPEDEDEEGPSMLDQQRFRTYWRLIDAEIDKASRYFLPQVD